MSHLPDAVLAGLSFGACRHQKIIVVDGNFAFRVGIDVTDERWDTSQHETGNPLRARQDESIPGPWHDVTSALTGPAASALAKLSRMRWHRATGEELTSAGGCCPSIWTSRTRFSTRRSATRRA